MKRISGENGVCTASEKYFCKQMKIGRKALWQSLKYLTSQKWITFIGKENLETKGGQQKVNAYKVNDIWKINNDHYNKGCLEEHPLSQGVSESNSRGAQKEHQGVSERTHKEEQYKEEHKEDIPKFENFGDPSSLKEEKYYPPSDEELRDEEIREAGGEPKKHGRNDAMALLYWAEERIGKKYPRPKAQMRSISDMLAVGYSVADIKTKWEELEGEDWHGGVNFHLVAGQIAKVKKQKKVNTYI